MLRAAPRRALSNLKLRKLIWHSWFCQSIRCKRRQTCRYHIGTCDRSQLYGCCDSSSVKRYLNRRHFSRHNIPTPPNRHWRGATLATRVFTTAAKLHTTENVLPHSYEVSNPMALSSYRHGTRKAATPVDIARNASSRHPSAGGGLRGDLIGFQECRRQSQVRTRLTAGESGIRYLTSLLSG